MIMSPNQRMRLHWDADKGWILDVPMALPDSALRKAVDWALPHQKQRLMGLPLGPKRDELTAAIKQLSEYKVNQRVIGARGDTKGDQVFFEATERETTRFISVGSN